MDFKVIMTTFGAVFLAEMADKTQLVGFGMASSTAKPFSVFIGSVAAYTIITGITVLIGASLGKFISPNFIRYFGGALFIGLGALMLLGKI